MPTFESKFAIRDKVTARHSKKSSGVEGEIVAVTFYPDNILCAIRSLNEFGHYETCPFYENTIQHATKGSGQ